MWVSFRRRVLLVFAGVLVIVVVLVLLTDRKLYPWRAVAMNQMSPNLQSLFQSVRVVCFGRFIIEVPDATQVIWGDAKLPLSVWVEKGQASELATRVSSVELRLKSEIRIPITKNQSLYIETIDGSVPGIRHVISQRDVGSEGFLRINSFAVMGDDLVVMEALPLEYRKNKALGMLDDIVLRLKPREESEMPAASGVCIDNGFLMDAPGAKAEDFNEHIQIGFRLKAHPDVHLSIYLGPANELDWSLEHQLSVTEEQARNSGRPAPYEGLKIFKRAAREVSDWKNGYEILARTPREESAYAHHDFWLKFTGKLKDPLHPFVDIQLQTGVDKNFAGTVKPSLTDEEAIALWDKLTSSIRVRPTSNTKTSKASKSPLGELHVTGHRCPQTGWWECNDDLNLA